MIEFITNNLLLILSIIVIVLGFLATVSEFVTKHKPVRFLIIIAILGLVVSVAYQIHSYNLEQEAQREQKTKEQIREAAQQVRDGIIDEININVRKTVVTVETIAARLETTSLSEVATELVTIRTGGDGHFEETIAFAKGSPAMWNQYATWLESLTGSTVAPSLSITLNAHHHYDTGLLLAYLLTSKATREVLEGVVSAHHLWRTFDAEQVYLDNLKHESGKVSWVLFYDSSTQNLVGFAQAQAFAQELMVYHRLGKHKEIGRLLNKLNPNPITELKKKFLSVQAAVFETKKPSELVQTMIREQLAVSVAVEGAKPYVVHLERMIQLAASGD